MIILTNKSYWGTTIKSYDIYHNGITEENEVRTDGYIAFSEVEGKGTVVTVTLYGDSWPEDEERGLKNYLLDIVKVLKIAEPNLLMPIIKRNIEKVNDEEVYTD